MQPFDELHRVTMAFKRDMTDETAALDFAKSLSAIYLKGDTKTTVAEAVESFQNAVVEGQRALFLEEVQRITDFQTTPVFAVDQQLTYTAESVDELIYSRVHQTTVDILSLIDTGIKNTNHGYRLIPVRDLEEGDSGYGLDIAGELGTVYFDLINT
jgi:hypothetical protein